MGAAGSQNTKAPELLQPQLQQRSPPLALTSLKSEARPLLAFYPDNASKTRLKRSVQIPGIGLDSACPINFARASGHRIDEDLVRAESGCGLQGHSGAV